MAIGHELLNVPMGDMIRQMAFAIADAQFELDESSVHAAEMMGGYRLRRDEEGNLLDASGRRVTDARNAELIDTRTYFGYEFNEATKKKEPVKLSMMELGFTPTFYQFIETVIEVKIAIKITRENSSTRDVKTKGAGLLWRRARGISVSTTSVDGTYSSKYSYSAEGSSLLRTKLVPVPPPPVLEERVRSMFESVSQSEENQK